MHNCARYLESRSWLCCCCYAAVFLQNNKSVRKFLLLCIFRYLTTTTERDVCDAGGSRRWWRLFRCTQTSRRQAAAADIFDISCTLKAATATRPRNSITLRVCNCGQSPPSLRGGLFLFLSCCLDAVGSYSLFAV